jgi:hypothetical protein
MAEYQAVTQISRLPEKNKYSFETDCPICQMVYAPLAEDERVQTFETSTRLYAAAIGKKVIGEVPVTIDPEKTAQALNEMLKPIVSPIEKLAQGALGPDGSVERVRTALQNLSTSLKEQIDEIVKGTRQGDTQTDGKLENLAKQVVTLTQEVMRQKFLPKEKEARELDVLSLLSTHFFDDQFEPVGKVKEYDIEAMPTGLKHFIPIEVRDRQQIYPNDLREALDKTDQPVHYYANITIPASPSKYTFPQITIETIGGRYVVLCISEDASLIPQGYKIAKVCLGLIEAGEAELVKEKMTEIRSCLEDLNSISRSATKIKTSLSQISTEVQAIEDSKDEAEKKLEDVLAAMMA